MWLLLWHFSILAGILFLALIYQDHTERRVLYKLWALFDEVLWVTCVIWVTMVMKLLLLVQLCIDLLLWDLIPVFQLVGWLWRRFCSFPLHLYLFTGILWVHCEALSRCCQLYVNWWVMLPMISLCNVVSIYWPGEKDLVSQVWIWHVLFLFHVGWVLKFLTWYPIYYLLVAEIISKRTIFK